MAEGSEQTPGPVDEDPFAIDTSIARPARVQNYLAGGDSNFSVDQRAAEDVGEAIPGGVETARAVVRALGAFVGRSVRYLAGEAGTRQFLNIGVAVPTEKFVHKVAQQAAPESRFVYVSDDPMVLAHAHTLRQSSPEGASDYIHGSLRDLRAVLLQAAATLDFTEPIGAILPTTLVFVPDDGEAFAVVAELTEALAPGSHLVVAHSTFDIEAEGMHDAAERLDQSLVGGFTPRSRADIAKFFDGLEVVEPGLVPIEEWRADPKAAAARASGRPVAIFGGVGRKP